MVSLEHYAKDRIKMWFHVGFCQLILGELAKDLLCALLSPFPSALCFSRLACVGYISGFLALGILIGSANRIHCRRLECEKRMGSGFFLHWLPFYKVTSGWLPPEGCCSQGNLLYWPSAYQHRKITVWLSLILFLCLCSGVPDSGTPRTVAHQAPLSMEFSGQE